MDVKTIMHGIVYRKPVSEDGMAVNRLIGQCKPLDENSVYCNLLQCSHFAETSIIALLDEKVVGFVSGYLVPAHSDTLFIWQIAVDESVRGRGLAKRLLSELLCRTVCRGVCYLEASIMPDNNASRAVFLSLAKELKSECKESVMFDKDRHFQGRHETEFLLRIGPFSLAS
jgi:L-2,4-diaminobutyric acid acetyltransferase